MNKSLVFKIAIGLVVVSVPFMISMNKKENIKVEETPQIEMSQEDNDDVYDNLYDDTFNEGSSDTHDVTEEEKQVDETEEALDDLNKEAEEVIQENEKEEQANSKTSTGSFQGFADGNFIEVKIGDNYSVFKVSGNVKSKLENKNIGDSITFTYVTSAGQQLITSIN